MNNVVSWLALVIAVIALIIGWAAFNRSGADLEEVIEAQVEEAVVEIRADLERAEDAAREGTADTLEAGADAAREGAEAADAGADDVRTENQ